VARYADPWIGGEAETLPDVTTSEESVNILNPIFVRGIEFHLLMLGDAFTANLVLPSARRDRKLETGMVHPSNPNGRR
jgi:hypothetical protein